MHIGNKIQEVIRERGMSVPAFASAIHCTRGNVYKILGKSSIDTELLLKISEVLEYDFFKEYSSCIQFGYSIHNGYKNRVNQ